MTATEQEHAKGSDLRGTERGDGQLAAPGARRVEENGA